MGLPIHVFLACACLYARLVGVLSALEVFELLRREDSVTLMIQGLGFRSNLMDAVLPALVNIHKMRHCAVILSFKQDFILWHLQLNEFQLNEKTVPFPKQEIVK